MKAGNQKKVFVFAGAGIFLIVIIWIVAGRQFEGTGSPVTTDAEMALAGSSSCRTCHQRFYELWAPSFHGLAMQPYDDELAQVHLTSQVEGIEIGDFVYCAEVAEGQGWVLESGLGEENRYNIAHVMGGKNVYYFLTPTARGRLQVLPVAFDVRRNQWFNTTASAVRHFVDMPDEELDWREQPLTFNTSCYGCHVSQLATNYDLETDTYATLWAEPGINCETCHGPSAAHVQVCQDAPEGSVPDDLKVIKTSHFTPEQTDGMCAPCHAKMSPITTDFSPGDAYFDHYDLVTLEHIDFYPDGRDLGENYTFTSWRQSLCVTSGQLDCIHCHTSSGRYRFAGESTNQACLPCHEDKVEDAAGHSFHPEGDESSQCVSCHMPKTEFARMLRSDHSMRPPTPATTTAYASPNACNLCHEDRDAAWADRWVRQWRSRDYQAPVLYRAGLIDAARKEDWSRSPDMLAYIASQDRDEVFTASLIRLLVYSNDERIWPVLVGALQDPAPLVRSAAAAALEGYAMPEVRSALLAATEDTYRLVRIRAAMALSGLPPQMMTNEEQQRLAPALDEYEASLQTRPDHWTSYYNLGNFYFNRGDVRGAIASFETASKLHPDVVAPLVNAALAYSSIGQNGLAEEQLRGALEREPASAAAHFNLGLLKAEQGDLVQAEHHLRVTLETDPSFAEAAYNLGILLASDRLEEAIESCRKAADLRPNEPRYAYTYAYYLSQNEETSDARDVLRQIIYRHPAYADAYLLLGMIYEEKEQIEEAATVYRQALESDELPDQGRYAISQRLQVISPN